jgi:hypothetical protein
VKSEIAVQGHKCMKKGVLWAKGMHIYSSVKFAEVSEDS